MGAELAGVHLMDRFVGTMMPVFRSSRLNLDIHYNPPGIRGEPRYLEGVARLTKLHGSVDWIQNGSEIRRVGVPLGADDIAPYLNAPGLQSADALKLMIYPNSAKDRETAEYPYVELFRDFAAAICRPNSTLVTYGYGFGDEHINRVIHDMLTIPSTHLVVISFNDPISRILKFYYESAHYAQMSILIGKTWVTLPIWLMTTCLSLLLIEPLLEWLNYYSIVWELLQVHLRLHRQRYLLRLQLLQLRLLPQRPLLQLHQLYSL